MWVSCFESQDCFIAHLCDQLIGVPPSITIGAQIDHLTCFLNDLALLIAVDQPTRYGVDELGDVD